MTTGEKQRKFTLLVAKLIAHIYESGYEVTLGDAYATAGHIQHSFHYIRLAIDLNLFKDGEWLKETRDHAIFGYYWESLDPMCSWGGHFDRQDGNHYSYGEGKLDKQLTV